MDEIASVQGMIGLEIHVQLATNTKAFSRASNPARQQSETAPPNSLIDPTVLALPGALPVLNKAAVEMAVRVGLALNCAIPRHTKWDRKSYFYPDLPKGYQISQYDQPVCGEGAIELPAVDDKGNFDTSKPATTIRIVRAHLEEDAGKLLHEAPGGGKIDGSIADYNRAGAPLLEIVTAPDFVNANQVVAFAKLLRNICRALGVSHGVMQQGHMRFEPNINTVLTLKDGRTVKTPIVEIKNLNSFRALRLAVEHELANQPARWAADKKEMGRGMKTTRGWDEASGSTFVQREKEDAHDYRYFPDPDLPPVVLEEAWVTSLRDALPELPLARLARYGKEFALSAKESQALTEEQATAEFFDACVGAAVGLGVPRPRAGRAAANLVLQSGGKRANEKGVMVQELGIAPGAVAGLAQMREEGQISAQGADELFGELCAAGANIPDIKALAKSRGLLIVRDDAALARWVAQAIEENAQAAADVRAGKEAAAGRIVGAVMKLAGGSADAKSVREAVLAALKP